MAVGVLTAAPEFTKQVYDDVTEKMFGHPSPMRDAGLSGNGSPGMDQPAGLAARTLELAERLDDDQNDPD